MDQSMQNADRPDLNLAGVDGWSVASGRSIGAMSEPVKPVMTMPVLRGSPEQGGIDPAQPIPRLNLAGSEGFPAPAQLARSADLMDSGSDSVHTPDFSVPAMDVPDLRPYDLVAPGIDYAYGAEFAPDPLVPDVSQYAHPYGLDIHNPAGDGADLFRPDPVIGDLLNPELPQGLQVVDHPLQPDPTMPDLQNPQLDQEVHMLARPGDLAPDALDVMHAQLSYDEVEDVPYTQSFMDQAGMNTTRRRHMDLLQGGLG